MYGDHVEPDRSAVVKRADESAEHEPDDGTDLEGAYNKPDGSTVVKHANGSTVVGSVVGFSVGEAVLFLVFFDLRRGE